MRPGAIFVAVSGVKEDGHAYAQQAVARGAVAVVGNKAEGVPGLGAPYIQVRDPRRAAGLIAHALAGDPTRDMTVLGITGTNGKSSTAYLTQSILQHASLHSDWSGKIKGTANFGTMGYFINGTPHPAPHTTPFGEDLARLFQQAKEEGVSHAVMEVSSHALEQERVAGIHFQAGAFTNLTQDHLDFHEDMDAYKRAKLRLFERIEGDNRFTVVNVNDPAAPAFLAASKVRCYTFGKGGDYKASKIEVDISGTRFELKTPSGRAQVHFRLLGKHNVMNALCAAALCGGLGLPIELIASGLAALPRVPGRFEAVDAGQNFFVIVDYAHTEDGLLNVLQAARKICKNRLITLFGCGGDRDKGKRAKMAAVAARYSDYSIITSDNPRTEDPHRILLDVEVGMQHAGKRKDDDYLVIENRADAIRTAIDMARAGDFVMIAGKGHEDYQILGTERIHFDDREVARGVLEARRGVQKRP